ncbi:MAG: hypothetical protein RLZZ435_3258, partial [Cyanobacteriota bacterium]
MIPSWLENLLHWLSGFGSTAVDPSDELPLGTIVDKRYKIVAVLGRGGFARTYRAQQLNCFDQEIALKEFCPDPRVVPDFSKARELFEREAKVLHQLQHPLIPQFYETIVEKRKGKRRFFLVQEYISGDNYNFLRTCEYSQGMPEAEVKQLLRHLLSVLDYLHSQTPPVLHRDISPDNIIRCKATGLPKLIDFGAVKQLFHTLSDRPDTQIGKKGFAPPEQFLGHQYLTPSCDLYALGSTAIVLLTGRSLNHLVSSAEEWNWEAYVPEGVSPEFAALLNRLTATIVNARFQSAQAVLAALNAETARETLPAETPPPSAEPLVQFKEDPIDPILQPSPVSQDSLPPQPTPLPPQTWPVPRPVTDPFIKVFKDLLSPEFRRFVTQQVIYVSIGSIGLIALVGPFWGMDKWKNTSKDPPNPPTPTPTKTTVTNTETECDRFNGSNTLAQLSDSDFNILMQDVDSAFWEEHPELNEISLAPEDPRRQEWCAIGNELLA